MRGHPCHLYQCENVDVVVGELVDDTARGTLIGARRVAEREGGRNKKERKHENMDGRMKKENIDE